MEGGQEGGRGWGEGDREGGNGEGETGMGKWGGVEVLARDGSGEEETGSDRLGSGNEEDAMGRGRWGGGNRKRDMGKGAKGRGRRRGKRRGEFTDGYDEMTGWTYGMPGWNEVTVFSDFVYPCNAGYPS